MQDLHGYAELASAPPVLLSIAGLDPSSGAGFTADLKVFAAHGVYGVACPTAWTVQSTRGVRQVCPADPALVRDTLACLGEDFSLSAVKIGMLATGPVLDAVCAWLAHLRSTQPGLPVVLDPVLRSTSGMPLFELEALPRLRAGLLPLVSVVTPNLDEAALLADQPAASTAEAEQSAAAILRQMGSRASGVVVTGGHHRAAPDDFVLTASGQSAWLTGTRVATTSTHGTGCAYSSALACALAEGAGLLEAARAAKRYVEQALHASYPVGRGRGPMHHLFRLDR